MKYDCLILDVNYKPYDIWDWQHAISKLLCTNSVKIVYGENGPLYYDKTVRDGQGNEYQLPAVLILDKYTHQRSNKASYTKYNIYSRDLFQCQYCGEEVNEYNRTVDHIVPKQFFNPKRYGFALSSFLNVVTCCKHCNLKKRNRTPIKAGMTLIRKPTHPSREQVYKNKLIMLHNTPECWKNFLK